ncbi:MAG: WD40 repeat domain-containing protein [Leptolyngbyaceae bacterium]|nr:WD40 repeat domain-containing protein [Leptolyngbyaceae bacterium]
MELELGLKLLLQGLPAIAQIFELLQKERLIQLQEHQTRKVKAIAPPDRSYEPIPLRIVLLTPQLPPDFWPNFGGDATQPPNLERRLAQELAEFLRQHYPFNSLIRPTEFLTEDCDLEETAKGQIRIQSLFKQLRAEPTLVLESEILGEDLSLRMAYWGYGQKNYAHATLIPKLPWREIFYESAKQRAFRWREIADQLLACGESPEVVAQLGADNIANWEQFQNESKWQRHGIDLKELPRSYQINHKDVAAFCQFLTTYHCLVASWMADAHHLIHHNVTPQLPDLLPDLIQTVPDPQLLETVLQTVIQSYEAHGNGVGFKPYLIPVGNEPKYTSAHHTGGNLVPLNGKSRDLISHPLPLHPPLEQVVLTRTLTGHSGKAAAIAVSLDGQSLASGSEDHTIKLWHCGTGELLQTLPEDAEVGRVLMLALSQDGQILASGHRRSDRSSIKVWHLPTHQLLHTFTGHKNWIYSLAISPDAKILVSGSHKIKVWDLGTGELVRTLTGHKKWVYSLAVSPNGQILASASADKTIRIWHLPTGELLSILYGHSDWVRTLAISVDGQTLASGSDDNTIKLWHLSSGTLLRTLTGHTDWVLSVAISPDGQTLISGSRDHTIKFWHMQTGALLRTLTGHKRWIHSLAVSSDGRMLVSGSEDKTIKIWQVS